MNQGTPVVACLRCRKQKLRCTREQPECRRCQRAKSQCSYPLPPNRKKLANQRGQERACAATFDGAVPPEHTSQIRNSSKETPSDAFTLGDTALCEPLRAGLRPSEGPLPQIALNQLSSSPHVNKPSPILDRQEEVCLSNEIALFLIEIYFERHYQADLLFDKQTFSGEFLAQRLPCFVSLAVFAFASLFLTHVPGGTIQGNIGLTEFPQADWRTIGQRWAEQASQATLMNADKPRLEHVQACQILAMFWLAKAETVRTNIHTAIAYRTCCLLQFNQVSQDSVNSRCVERELKTRCFWACWLTKCASQRNAHFQTDCWADVVGCPLPIDSPADSGFVLTRCLDKIGMVQEEMETNQPSKMGFNSSLVVVQGLWWEVQQYVQSIQQNRDTLPDSAAKFYSLHERLESLHDRMDGSIRYALSNAGVETISTDSGRIFSLNYLYHLCQCYLHSSLVPVLSCGTQTPRLSRKTLRLAAEQTWKHSMIMTDMTERFVMRKVAVSKLWPIVGYGAYVCAAIQLRCFVALGILDNQRLERSRVHLLLTGEIKNYWMTLQPLYADMERQFVQAASLTSSKHGCHDQSKDDSGGELSNLIDRPNASPFPSFSSAITTYVADEDKRELTAPIAQADVTPVNSAGMSHPLQTTNASELLFQSDSTHSTGVPDVTESPFRKCDPPITQSVDGMGTVTFPTVTQGNDWWWDQDPEALGEVFGKSLFLPDLSF